VDSEYSAGKYEEARKASNTAKILNTVGITIGSTLYVVHVIYIVIGVATTSSS